MKVTPHARRLGLGGLIALVLVLVFAVSPLAAVPNYETRAYYSAVRDEPSAPFTDAEEAQRTSLHAYYSVVRDEPVAPFTEDEKLELKRTSTIAYYSVVH